jgi:hypothetical protein
MADLPPPPLYHLLSVSLPEPPLTTITELDERAPQRASAVYPTTPREETSSESLRHNITKLLLARWGHVDPSKYGLIMGLTDGQQEKIYIAQIKKKMGGGHPEKVYRNEQLVPALRRWSNLLV